jgi:hypothetical protein
MSVRSTCCILLFITMYSIASHFVLLLFVYFKSPNFPFTFFDADPRAKLQPSEYLRHNRAGLPSNSRLAYHLQHQTNYHNRHTKHKLSTNTFALLLSVAVVANKHLTLPTLIHLVSLSIIVYHNIT